MKDTTNLIRVLVVLEVLVLFLAVGISIYMEQYLPQLLQEYLNQEFESSLIEKNLFVFSILAFAFLLLYVAAVIGILLVKAWARNFYILSLVAGFVAMPLIGPTVEHGFAQAFTDLGLLISGAVSALLLFTTSAFNKLKNEDASKAGTDAQKDARPF